MTSFQLSKGDRFDIKKGLVTLLVGLGWNPAAHSGEEFDLDAHAFGLVGGKHREQDGRATLALTYANKAETVPAPELNAKAFKTKGGEMTHMGDNRDGQGDGDDEQIRINLDKLPHDLDEVAVWVSIYDAARRSQDFGRVEGAFVRVVDASTGEELCKYSLAEKFPGSKSVHVGSLKRSGSEWTFVAVGTPLEGELADVLASYARQ